MAIEKMIRLTGKVFRASARAVYATIHKNEEDAIEILVAFKKIKYAAQEELLAYEDLCGTLFEDIAHIPYYAHERFEQECSPRDDEDLYWKHLLDEEE